MPLLFSYGTLQRTDVQLSVFGRMLVGFTDNLLNFRLSELNVADEADRSRVQRQVTK